jgi:N-acetylglucosaminyldiphosphoundecaprenol N-acetyl-beta-D-mannosaminyltransferase
MSSVELPVVTLCNFPVSRLSLSAHADLVASWGRSKQGKWLVTLNLQFISEGQLNPGFEKTLRHADFFVADGIPFVWLSKLKRKPILDRTPGVELVELLLSKYSDLSFAIVGGDNPRLALQKLNFPYPEQVFIYADRVIVAEDFVQGLAKQLLEYQPQILFVALGEPKQTYFISLLRPHLPHTVIMGVGGTFEMLADLKPRAPQWVQGLGFEWLYRLLLEPRRLWRRYLLHYPLGVWRLLRDLF